MSERSDVHGNLHGTDGRFSEKERAEAPVGLGVHPIFGEVIHVYSRQDALDDAVLIDAGAMAEEAGFKYPVAFTAAVYRDTIEWPDGSGLQHEEGRKWDVLWMAAAAARRRTAPDANATDRTFSLHRVPRGRTNPEEVTLRMVCGPGDNAEPVITIMRLDED